MGETLTQIMSAFVADRGLLMKKAHVTYLPRCSID